MAIKSSDFVVGNKNKGISVYKVKTMVRNRKSKVPKWVSGSEWMMCVWRGGRIYTHHGYETKSEAVAEAKDRSKRGWFD